MAQDLYEQTTTAALSQLGKILISDFCNDDDFVNGKLNEMRVNFICPFTEKHINKNGPVKGLLC